MGNIYRVVRVEGELKASTVKGGIETMIFLTEWYRANSGGKGVGFFQIAGGISGDFPICVVPMMYQDLEWEDVPFCGLLLPDFGLDDLVRIIFGRRSETKRSPGANSLRTPRNSSSSRTLRSWPR